MTKETAKKTLGIASRVLTWIVVIAAVLMMVFTLVSTLVFDKNDRSLFGTRFYVVLTDSMSPSEKNKADKVHFEAGDIVLIRDVKDKTALKDGDIIAFISQNSDSFGETVTHKIREKKVKDGEVLGYVTYGTNTGVDDEVLVEPEYVLGKYSGKIPNLGHVFTFLRTTAGYVVCVLTPFLLIMAWQGANIVKLLRRYRREQRENLEAERAEIAKEREESAKMLQELEALKAQLEKQNAENTAPEEKADDTEKTD